MQIRVIHLALLAAVLSALSAPAPAQTLPLPAAAPMRRDPNQSPGGITVSSTGTASAPATSATFTLRLSTRNGRMQLNAQTLQPAIEAMVRAERGRKPSSTRANKPKGSQKKSASASGKRRP